LLYFASCHDDGQLIAITPLRLVSYELLLYIDTPAIHYFRHYYADIDAYDAAATLPLIMMASRWLSAMLPIIADYFRRR